MYNFLKYYVSYLCVVKCEFFVGCKGDVVNVSWSSENKFHNGSFPLPWLEKYDYSDAEYQDDLFRQSEPVTAVSNTLTIVLKSCHLLFVYVDSIPCLN